MPETFITEEDLLKTNSVQDCIFIESVGSEEPKQKYRTIHMKQKGEIIHNPE